MRYQMTLMGVLLVGLSVLAAPAGAQVPCGERENLAAKLKTTYQEVPVSMGLSKSGAVIEVFASEAGSYTILRTNASGLSCLVDAGELWDKVDIQPATGEPGTGT